MSAEQEQALLGAVFMQTSIYDKASEIVTDADFVAGATAALWRACGRAIEAGVQPDPITVQSYLNGDGDVVREAGGKSYVHSLIGLCPSVVRWRGYADAIHEESATYRLKRALREVIDSGATGDALLAAAQDVLLGMQEGASTGSSMDAALKAIWAESEQPKKTGLLYPWPRVNEATHGLRPGWLCVLGGETGHGKTAAALALCEKLILENRRVLYVSLEMQAEELATRLAQRAGFPSEAVYSREASSTESAALLGLINQEQWKLFRVERAGNAERIAALIRRYDPELVVVDHLHLMETAGRESRYEATTRHSRELKLLAGRYKVPVLALAQLSRTHPSEKDRVPGLSRLRDSGAIEQDADTVLFVWLSRNDMGILTSEGAMRVAKSRMGTTGVLRMVFTGPTQKLDVKEVWGQVS